MTAYPFQISFNTQSTLLYSSGVSLIVHYSVKPQEQVGFSVLLKDTDKDAVSGVTLERQDALSDYQDTLLHIFSAKSPFSTAATVFLTLWSCPCWCSVWAMFAEVFCLCFRIKTASFTWELTFGWLFYLALHPILTSFASLFSLRRPTPELWLHWPRCPRSPCKEGNLTLNRKPVSLLLLAANGAAVF